MDGLKKLEQNNPKVLPKVDGSGTKTPSPAVQVPEPPPPVTPSVPGEPSST